MPIYKSRSYKKINSLPLSTYSNIWSSVKVPMPPVLPYHKVIESNITPTIKEQAKRIGIDPIEMDFLLSQIIKTDNEILLHSLKKLIAEAKIVLSSELSTHLEDIKNSERLALLKKQQAQQTQQNFSAHLKQKDLVKRMEFLQGWIDDFEKRYISGVSIICKNRLKKDKKVRDILEKYFDVRFEKYHFWPFTHIYIDKNIPKVKTWTLSTFNDLYEIFTK